MAFVVFDTETTGLPSKFIDATPSNIKNWDSCRIVQIAWEIYNNSTDTSPVSSQCYVVSPDGFTIPSKSSSIHGISTEDALANGTPISNVITLFMNDITKHNVTTAVAHNMSFDSNVFLSEMYRNKFGDVDIWKDLRKHCTMIAGTKRGGRWPKLNDLYKSLIGPVDNSLILHRADVDTKLCADIYKVQASL